MKEGVPQGWVASQLLVKPACSSCPGVRRLVEIGGLEVYQAILYLEKHHQSVVVPALFEAVPLKLLEESCDCAWRPIAVAVAGVPGGSPLNFLQELDVLFFVGVPDSGRKFQHRSHHGGVCSSFDHGGAVLEVSAKESNCPVSSGCY